MTYNPNLYNPNFTMQTMNSMTSWFNKLIALNANKSSLENYCENIQDLHYDYEYDNCKIIHAINTVYSQSEIENKIHHYDGFIYEIIFKTILFISIESQLPSNTKSDSLLLAKKQLEQAVEWCHWITDDEIMKTVQDEYVCNKICTTKTLSEIIRKSGITTYDDVISIMNNIDYHNDDIMLTSVFNIQEYTDDSYIIHEIGYDNEKWRMILDYNNVCKHYSTDDMIKAYEYVKSLPDKLYDTDVDTTGMMTVRILRDFFHNHGANKHPAIEIILKALNIMIVNEVDSIPSKTEMLNVMQSINEGYADEYIIESVKMLR